MSWLRIYTDLIDDRKQAQLSDKTFRIFILLLCFAKEIDSNGSINQKISEISWRIRKKEKYVLTAIQELQSLDILAYDSTGISFINWDKRQFASDDINERVKRHRAKKETLHETLHVTPPDTEQKETDADIKKTLHSSFEELWKKYPNKDGRKAAEKYFRSSVKTEHDCRDIKKALENYLRSDRVKKGFVKNGSSWFNNWRDWIDSPISDFNDNPLDDPNLIK